MSRGERLAHCSGHALIKLMWQLTGRMRYESSSRKFDIAPGDLLVTSMGEDYRLKCSRGTHLGPRTPITPREI